MIHIKVMQEMLHSGDLLHPTIAGEPYYSKPPLKMWLAMIPLQIFGESNLTYRLVNGLSGIGIFILTYLFALSLFSSRLSGYISVLTLAGSRHLIIGPHGVRNATQDPLMILLSTAALFCCWLIASNSNFNHKKLKLIFGILIGLAVFTKSVAGLVPLVFMGVFYLSNSELRKKLTLDYKYWFGGLILGFLPLLLFVVYHLNENATLFINTIYNETINRALIGYHNQDERYYYLKELFKKNSVATPIILAVALVYHLFCFKNLNSKFLLSWSLIPLLGYSLVNSRLPWYILISYPALALCVGGIFAKLKEKKLKSEKLKFILPFVLLVVLSLRAGVIFTELATDKQFNIDKALERIKERSDSRLLAYKDPLRFGISEPNLRLQIERVYLNMAQPTYRDTVEGDFKNFFCLNLDCLEIRKALGEPTEVISLEPYLTRKEKGYFLIYQ